MTDTPLCPTCRLPLDVDARRDEADEAPDGDVTCWTCEACGLPAWGWDWDDKPVPPMTWEEIAVLTSRDDDGKD